MMKFDPEVPAIKRQLCFQPPFCPNKFCKFHLGYPLITASVSKLKSSPYHWHSKGWEKKKTFPYWARRFQCQMCRRNFRYSSLKLHYREKRYGLNSKIFHLFTNGISNRGIGRSLHCSEHLVRMRLLKMARLAFLRQSELLNDTKIEEALVYDGIENFAKSQYEPNNINELIGKESYFIYDFNFSPLNRKGKMSPRQKRVRTKLDQEEGRFSTRAIRACTTEIFARAYGRREDPQKPLTIYSDRHYEYERAVKGDLKEMNIHHIRISSKDYRNYKNHLFAVNHTDMLLRQQVGAYKRETISFAKKHERMIQKYALFMVWKNFMRPQFVKRHKRNLNTNTHSPAMHLKITDKLLEFHEFFNLLLTPNQIPLNREWEHFYHEKLTYSRVVEAR